jgi:hypothetical protein
MKESEKAFNSIVLKLFSSLSSVYAAIPEILYAVGNRTGQASTTNSLTFSDKIS